MFSSFVNLNALFLTIFWVFKYILQAIVAAFILLALVFLYNKYVVSRFLSSSVSETLAFMRNGVLVFRPSRLSWGCLSFICISEGRRSSSALSIDGISLNEALIHNFVITLNNIMNIPVTISLLIRREKSSLLRYLIISSRSIFLRKALKRVIRAREALSSYLSSLGFVISSPNKEDYRKLLECGLFFMPKFRLSFRMGKDDEKFEKIDSTTLSTIKNLLFNLPDDHGIMLVIKRFPWVDNVSRENGDEVFHYKFGLYLFCPEKIIESFRKISTAILSSVLNTFLLTALVKKTSRSRIIRSSVSQLAIFPRNNIVLETQKFAASTCRTKVFSGILNFLLASVEEKVLPRLIIFDEMSTGNIKLGHQLMNGQPVKPFCIGIDDLRRHLLIVGPTGAGKTTLAKIIIYQLLKLRKRPAIWILDFHGEYVSLRDLGFIVISPGKEEAPLGLNIFDPGSEDPEIYANFLSGLLNELVKSVSDSFSPQMQRIVSAAIYDVVMDENEKRRNPIFFLQKVFDICEELSPEIPSAKLSLHAILNRLKVIFSGVARHVFWVTKTNIDVKSLLGMDIVFDLSYFSARDPTKKALWIFVNVLLRYIYSEIIGEEKLITEDPRVFIIIEEARYVAPAIKKNDESIVYAAEDLVLLGRKYGISLCFITQSADNISRDIISNAGAVFMMGDAPREIIDKALSHTTTKYLQIMPAREALVKISTKSALMHVKLDDISQLEIPHRIRKPENDVVLQELRNNYSPIGMPYERFVLKLTMREITASELSYTL